MKKSYSQINEERELILDFLNADKYFNKYTQTYFYKIHKNFNLPKLHIMFHDDWNLLTVLVDKIESLVIPGRKPMIVHTVHNNCEISEHQFNTDTGDYFVDVTTNTKIESVYYACICFIKWYNLNVKNDINTNNTTQT